MRSFYSAFISDSAEYENTTLLKYCPDAGIIAFDSHSQVGSLVTVGYCFRALCFPAACVAYSKNCDNQVCGGDVTEQHYRVACGPLTFCPRCIVSHIAFYSVSFCSGLSHILLRITAIIGMWQALYGESWRYME